MQTFRAYGEEEAFFFGLQYQRDKECYSLTCRVRHSSYTNYVPGIDLSWNISQVCCTDSLARLPKPDVTVEHETVVTVVTVEPVVTDEPEVTEEPEVHDSFTVLSDLLPTAAMCKVKMAKRIIGGKKTLEDEFPWMVLLEYNKRNYKLSSAI